MDVMEGGLGAEGELEGGRKAWPDSSRCHAWLPVTVEGSELFPLLLSWAAKCESGGRQA